MMQKKYLKNAIEFHDKIFWKTRRENFFNLVKDSYTKPTANILLKDERLNTFL